MIKEIVFDKHPISDFDAATQASALSFKIRVNTLIGDKPNCLALIESLSILVLGSDKPLRTLPPLAMPVELNSTELTRVATSTSVPDRTEPENFTLEFICLKTFKSIKQVRISQLKYSKMIFRRGLAMRFILITKAGLQEISLLKGPIRQIPHDKDPEKTTELYDMCFLDTNTLCVCGNFLGIRLIDLSSSHIVDNPQQYITEIEREERYSGIKFDKKHGLLLLNCAQSLQIKVLKAQVGKIFPEIASINLKDSIQINYLGYNVRLKTLIFYSPSSFLLADLKPSAEVEEHELKKKDIINATFVPSLNSIISVERNIANRRSLQFNVGLYNPENLSNQTNQRELSDHREKHFLVSAVHKMAISLAINYFDIEFIKFVKFEHV